MPEGYAWLEKAGLIGALFVGLIALGRRLFVPIATLQEARADALATLQSARADASERYAEMKAMKDAQIAELQTDNERWRKDYRALEEHIRSFLRMAETVVKSKDTP